ncbi:MAG: hypothetical protein LPK03_12775 [Pontibacter sp.]|nr:hypothetical protein [Pontibacter sp.]
MVRVFAIVLCLLFCAPVEGALAKAAAGGGKIWSIFSKNKEKKGFWKKKRKKKYHRIAAKKQRQVKWHRWQLLPSYN